MAYPSRGIVSEPIGLKGRIQGKAFLREHWDLHADGGDVEGLSLRISL
jgi:hypothetical protein